MTPPRFALLPRFLLRLILPILGVESMAQHSHINAGAKSAAIGSPLFFANGGNFESASGFLIHLAPLPSPAYGPIFFGGANVTFTSLAATADNGGPSAFAARPGTHIEAIVETVSGPPGGAFSFWDSYDGFFDATEISFTVPVGTLSGTNRFALSENDGSAGSDPYGHIHGRKMSVEKPGLYSVGIRLVDSGGNGPGGGPLHAPSELVFFNLQAGISIADIAPVSEGVRVRFGTVLGSNYFLEATESVGADARWQTVAGPVAGTGRLETTVLSVAASKRSFYRLRVE